MPSDNSPESGLRTDTESDQSTSSPPTGSVDPDPKPAPEPESSTAVEPEGESESEPDPVVEATPPEGADDASAPSNESGSCRKAQAERKANTSETSDDNTDTDTATKTVLGEMADNEQYTLREDGGNDESGSGAIFDDTDVTKWGFFAFVGFEMICAGFAALVLYFIYAHGVHHAPWFMWTGLGVLIFAFLAAAFGGLAAAKSMMDAAGGLASKSQSQNSEHRE